MATTKPVMTQKQTLIIAGVGAALIALITFLPASKPVVIAGCSTVLEQNGYTVSATEVIPAE